MYHYSGDNNAQWPGSYCWPEGFMRRLAQYGGATVQLLLTPELVLDMLPEPLPLSKACS